LPSFLTFGAELEIEYEFAKNFDLISDLSVAPISFIAGAPFSKPFGRRVPPLQALT
jgi:hypothetical protein